MKPYILGIDPGLTGGLALIHAPPIPRQLLTIIDLPPDPKDLATTLDMYAQSIRFAVVEKVGAMVYTNKFGEKRGQGAKSSFAFGKGYGLLLGTMTALSIPFFEINPSVWKILLGLSSNKAKSIQKAKELYPESASFLTLKKHDGRAEALLLAHFGRERFCK